MTSATNSKPSPNDVELDVALKSEFNFKGNRKARTEITSLLQKCKIEHQLTHDALVDAWLSYSTNKNIDGITLDHMDGFKRELNSQHNKSSSSAVREDSKLGKRSRTNNHHRLPMSHTPDKKRNSINVQTPAGFSTDTTDLSPMTQTPALSARKEGHRVSISPALYNSRKDAGIVVSQMNSELEHCRASGQSSGVGNDVQIKFSEMNMKQREFGVPCINLAKIVQSERDRIMELGQIILDREDLEYTQCNIPSTSTAVTYGRICNEASSGKLNAASILLEGYTGARVKLDLSSLQDTPPLFPGQVVVVQGQNPSGRTFYVEKIWKGLNGEVQPQTCPVDGLTMMFAVGPFSDKGLDFAPLGDLLNGQVKEFMPKVLVLMGPFCNGADPVLEFDDGEVLSVDYETLFAQKVSDALEKILSECPSTHIVLVPSVNDKLNPTIYPQSPLMSRKSGQASQQLLKSEGLDFVMKLGDLGLPKSDRLHLTSNPSTFTIETVNPVTSETSNFAVSVTSMDLIKLLNDNVATGIKIKDRFKQLIETGVLAQRSMYPVRSEVRSNDELVDMSRQENFSLPHEYLPDLLVVPSFMRRKPETLNGGTVMINPGTLLKNGGGTYAKISVREGKVKADVLKI